MFRLLSSLHLGPWLLGLALMVGSTPLQAFAVDLNRRIQASPDPPPMSRPTTWLSQARPPAGLPSGTQVVVNGRSFSIPWSQWRLGTSPQVRIGLADWGVSQVLGVELLNTTGASQQPVQWFSDAIQTPLVAPVRLTPPFRYLDLTELGQRWGWQMQVSGTTLRVVSPPSNVLAIRQGKQSWGDRIVLDLDRPTPWQVNEAGSEAVVTLDASISPAIAQAFKSLPGNFVQTLRVEAAANQTRLRLTSRSRFRVWSLANPNRLIVDVRPDAWVEQDIQWAPGLRWRQQTVTLGTQRFPVLWLEVNPRQPGLTIQPILPNATTLVGTAPLLQTARQAVATAAINAGFFNRNNQLPLGAIRQDGRWKSGPILSRGAIAWDGTGVFKMGRLSLQETLMTSTGQRFPLTHLNSAYLQAGIARYTPDWGVTYTPLTDTEILIPVQNNQVIAQATTTSTGAKPVPIPVDGYLLVFRSNQTAATAFPPGTGVRLEQSVTPPDFDRFPQILAAGPLLVQNRAVVLDAAAEKFSLAFSQELAARSAIGLTPSGMVILATVHTRLGGGGASLTDIAQIMQQLGATDALNLDGGSSTTLYLGGQVRDRLPSSSARVHNGIGVFLSP